MKNDDFRREAERAIKIGKKAKILSTHHRLTSLGVPTHKDSNRLGLQKRKVLARRMGLEL